MTVQVCFGDARESQLATDLKEERIHALVWGALGAGWERQGRGTYMICLRFLLLKVLASLRACEDGALQTCGLEAGDTAGWM